MSKRKTKQQQAGQLTLFNCGAKRKRLEEVEPGTYDSDSCDSLFSPGSPKEDDCAGQAKQCNHVTVQNPRGTTTVVINSRNGSSSDQPSTSDGGSSTCTPSLPTDISSSPNQTPVQPSRLTTTFPLTLIGTKKRSFNPDWCSSHNWLEYSLEKNAAFCFACRHFTVDDGSRAEGTFTKVGFRDWKHATGQRGILQKHAQCSTHLHAMSAWHTYKINKECGSSIAESLDLLRNQEIRNNRHYLSSVIEVILLCARIEIALRGHDESTISLNKGNFLEIFG